MKTSKNKQVIAPHSPDLDWRNAKIVSVSRRCDIPAFHGDWFMNRLDAGFVEWVNPFGGQRKTVSLKPEDLIAFVFWSKNYAPFLAHLNEIQRRKYPVILNYTITGLPPVFEPNVPAAEQAISTLKALAQAYSPEHINWRYDPVVVSDITPLDYHRARFAELCKAVEGHVRRCYFSFPVMYGKVTRNLDGLSKERGVTVVDLQLEDRVILSQDLARIATGHGIDMFTCCEEALIAGPIREAHCIDGNLIGRLYYGGDLRTKRKPTRTDCGCTESVDIGAYDTCSHGCVYCYSTRDHQRAAINVIAQDPDSPSLGYGCKVNRLVTQSGGR